MGRPIFGLVRLVLERLGTGRFHPNGLCTFHYDSNTAYLWARSCLNHIANRMYCWCFVFPNWIIKFLGMGGIVYYLFKSVPCRKSKHLLFLVYLISYYIVRVLWYEWLSLSIGFLMYNKKLILRHMHRVAIFSFL